MALLSVHKKILPPLVFETFYTIDSGHQRRPSIAPWFRPLLGSLSTNMLRLLPCPTWPAGPPPLGPSITQGTGWFGWLTAYIICDSNRKMRPHRIPTPPQYSDPDWYANQGLSLVRGPLTKMQPMAAAMARRADRHLQVAAALTGPQEQDSMWGSGSWRINSGGSHEIWRHSGALLCSAPLNELIKRLTARNIIWAHLSVTAVMRCM